MSWIDSVSKRQAQGRLRELYQRVAGPGGNVDNVLQVHSLRPHTLEGEILEVNQVASYFAYVNRTVLGLGVTTEGDVLGLSPGDSDDPENWEHS